LSAKVVLDTCVFLFALSVSFRIFYKDFECIVFTLSPNTKYSTI
jgi:hypothetical protein